MIFSVKVPDFGQVLANVNIVKIYKKIGDNVSFDDIIMDIETEKATIEIRSHYSGFISEIFVKEGDLAKTGQNIFSIDSKYDLAGNSEINKEERIKISKLRKTMSARLKYIQNTAAIVTTFNEVDMTNIIKKRAEYKQKGDTVGLTPFFIKAVATILPNFPGVNAQIEDDYIIYKKYYNIGFAVDINNGLFISVIKNADKLNILEISSTIGDLVLNAKNNKLKAEDTENGTFTITNGGIYGSLFSTPIINPPQSGILGINAIIDRPVAINGQVVVKPMMYISLSYDHRIIDGKEAIGFLNAIKTFLQSIC